MSKSKHRKWYDREEEYDSEMKPYPFKWMAELEFPIERLTKDTPRR